MPGKNNKPSSGFLSFGRREQNILLLSILLTLCGAEIVAIYNQEWDLSLKIISPLIITLGVVIALKNLQSTEEARRIDKDREDSKFHYEIGVTLIERVESTLITQVKPELLGEGKSFSPYSIGKALRILETLRSVYSKTLDTHSKALRSEMDFLRDKLKTELRQIRVGHLCSLVDTGTYNIPVPSLVEKHNDYMRILKQSNPEAYAQNGPTDESTPFPYSVPCIDLCRFVAFLVDESDSFAITEVPSVEQTVETSAKFGFKTVREYLLLCQKYRNENIQLQTSSREELMSITS